jgi:hypothetical protein
MSQTNSLLSARLSLIHAALLALIDAEVKARREVDPDGELNNVIVADSPADPSQCYHIDIPRRQVNPGNPDALTSVGRALMRLGSTTVAIALAVTFSGSAQWAKREGYAAFACTDGTWHNAVLVVEDDGSIAILRGWQPVQRGADQGFDVVREAIDAAFAAGPIGDGSDEPAALAEIEGIGGRLSTIQRPQHSSAN